METIAEFWPFEAEQQKAMFYVGLAAFAGLIVMLAFALVRRVALLPETLLRAFSGWPSIAAPLVRAEKFIRNVLAAAFVCTLAALIVDFQIHGIKIDFKEIWEEDIETFGEGIEDLEENVEELTD